MIEEEKLKETLVERLSNLGDDLSNTVVSAIEVLLKTIELQDETYFFNLVEKESENVEGLAIIYVDKFCFSMRTINILHISTSNEMSL